MSGSTKNMSQSRPGSKNGMFGVHRYGVSNPFHGREHSEETKRKISEAKKGVITDEKHPMWLGDKVGYDSLHAWVRKKKGKPESCSSCGKSTGVLHWANKDNTYTRNLEDYLALCPKCHWAYDKKVNGKRTGVRQKQILSLRGDFT